MSTPGRSPFVTAVAWVFIVLSGWATLMLLIENAFVAVAFSITGIQDGLREAATAEGVPPFARFAISSLRGIVFGALVAAATLLVASIALLRRRNWGRMLFIGMLVLIALCQMAGAALPLLVLGEMRLPPDAPAQIELLVEMMAAVGALIALGFAVLYGWIAKRLLSREVAREFAGAQ